MTDHTDRITAALEALPKSEEPLKGMEQYEARKTLIAAAPDMAAEIVKLRKWQSEAVEQLKAIQKLINPKVRIFGQVVTMYNSKPTVVDRLIAEAKEQGDGL